MFVHADRDDLVELGLAREIAVIGHADFDAAGEARRSDALARLLALRLAERNAETGNAVIFRGPAQQPAPAAADVKQPITRLQSQFTADVIEFLLLRGVEVFITGREIGA